MRCGWDETAHRRTLVHMGIRLFRERDVTTADGIWRAWDVRVTAELHWAENEAMFGQRDAAREQTGG